MFFVNLVLLDHRGPAVAPVPTRLIGRVIAYYGYGAGMGGVAGSVGGQHDPAGAPLVERSVAGLGGDGDVFSDNNVKIREYICSYNI